VITYILTTASLSLYYTLHDDMETSKKMSTDSNSAPSPAQAPAPEAPTPRRKSRELTPSEVLKKASGAAFRGGLAGASAQAINVMTLMWMRTVMNYQYRYSGGFFEVFGKLYKDGGVPRLYRGLVPALMQAPLSRFGV
jgi:hypothetical protein